MPITYDTRSLTVSCDSSKPQTHFTDKEAEISKNWATCLSPLQWEVCCSDGPPWELALRNTDAFGFHLPNCQILIDFHAEIMPKQHYPGCSQPTTMQGSGTLELNHMTNLGLLQGWCLLKNTPAALLRLPLSSTALSILLYNLPSLVSDLDSSIPTPLSLMGVSHPIQSWCLFLKGSKLTNPESDRTGTTTQVI